MGEHVLQVRRAAHSGQTVRNFGENKKTKALLALKEAKDKGIDVYDLGSVQQIQTRSQLRLALWAIHLKSPTAALADALKHTEQTCGPSHQQPAMCDVPRQCFLSQRLWAGIARWPAHHVSTKHVGSDVFLRLRSMYLPLRTRKGSTMS